MATMSNRTFVSIKPISITDTTITFNALRNAQVQAWAAVKVVTKTEVTTQDAAIYVSGIAPPETVMSPSAGLCTKSPIGVYTPAVITASGDGVFGDSGTVKLGGTTLPAGAVTWSANSVVVDLSKQAADLANPWGSKPIVFTPTEPSLLPKSWNFSCGVSTDVTTKVNGSTDALTIDAGTAFTVSSVLNNALPATSFTATNEQYSYQSVADYQRDPWRYSVRSGLPIAAGDYYIRANIGTATWDREKYYQLENQNEVRVTLTGVPVSFTPKLSSGVATSIVYKGQLGDGTNASSNDITYTKTSTADTVTEVVWQYRNNQCSLQSDNNGWNSGLPKDVAIAPVSCGGDGITVTSWDIRVASFKMMVGGVDKSIYYLPTFNTFNLTITKKNLTISAVKSEKVFDGTTSVTLGDITVTGEVEGDNPSLDQTFAAGATFADAIVGAGKPITLAGPFALSTYWAGNYSLTNPGLVVTGKITKADAVLRLTASTNTVIMNNASPVSIEVTVKDARTNQPQIESANAAGVVLVNKSASVCSLSGTTVTAIKAGDCIIEATQAASANYNAAKSFSDDSLAAEQLVIKVYAAPKVLSVVADDVQVAVGENISLSSSTTGLIEGDSFNNVEYKFYQGANLLDTAPTAVGTYKIVPFSGGVTANAPEAYSETVKYVSAKLVITAAPPTITAVSPAYGPEKGGNKVTINGTGFTALTSVKLGETTIRRPNFVVNGTGTSLTFTIPAGKGGLPITLNAGSAQVSTDYNYEPDPVVIDKPFKIDLNLELKTGVRLAGQSLTVSGSGLKPNSEFTLIMRSTPLLILKGKADSKGDFKKKLVIPAKACLAPGLHSLKLDGINTANKAVSDTGYFTLADGCIVGAQAVQNPDKSWTLNGFNFEYRKSNLTKGGKASLNALVKFIKGAKSVTIFGYTETDTKSAAVKKSNLILAKARTEAVKAFLLAKGIKAKYVTVGKGGVDPVSLKDQAQNRRVVITAKY